MNLFVCFCLALSQRAALLGKVIVGLICLVVSIVGYIKWHQYNADYQAISRNWNTSRVKPSFAIFSCQLFVCEAVSLASMITCCFARIRISFHSQQVFFSFIFQILFALVNAVPIQDIIVTSSSCPASYAYLQPDSFPGSVHHVI
jgi:hypothetical protein